MVPHIHLQSHVHIIVRTATRRSRSARFVWLVLAKSEELISVTSFTFRLRFFAVYWNARDSICRKLYASLRKVDGARSTVWLALINQFCPSWPIVSFRTTAQGSSLLFLLSCPRQVTLTSRTLTRRAHSVNLNCNDYRLMACDIQLNDWQWNERFSYVLPFINISIFTFCKTPSSLQVPALSKCHLSSLCLFIGFVLFM